MKASMAKRIADRSSDSVRARLKPVSGCFQARSAAVTTPSAVGVNVCPRPASTPANAMTASAADVVISAPSPVRIVSTLSRTMRMPTSPSASSAKLWPSMLPMAPRTATNAKVRSPACFWRRSRSMPTKSPIANANASRASVGR